MSKKRIPSKAVSTKGKANNRKPVALTLERRGAGRVTTLEEAIASAESGFEMLLVDGERYGADAMVCAVDRHADRYKAVISLMRKSGDAESAALAEDLRACLDMLKKTARTVLVVVEKAKSRAAELGGR